jgi:hypothetical protein
VATLTVQTVANTGTVLTTATAAAGGDTFPNDGRTALKVVNAHSGAWVVTITRDKTCDQGFTHSLAVTVSAGMTKYIGPFPRDEFAHIISVTYDGVTALTVGAYRIGA